MSKGKLISINKSVRRREVRTYSVWKESEGGEGAKSVQARLEDRGYKVVARGPSPYIGKESVLVEATAKQHLKIERIVYGL